MEAVLNATRLKAQAKGVDCTLSLDTLHTILNRQCGRCAITGRQFSAENPDNTFVRPDGATVDQIIPGKGYM